MELADPAGLIEIILEGPDDLFERFDPAPAQDRHLARRVEQFILHRAEERPIAEYTLVVRIPGVPIPATGSAELARGIGHHFAHRGEEENAKLRALIEDGRRDLTIGLVFLFVCGLVAFFVVRLLPPALGLFVEQGLLILGWVALWRPVDMFLYELRPLRRRRDLSNALSKMDVRFEAAP